MADSKENLDQENSVSVRIPQWVLDEIEERLRKLPRPRPSRGDLLVEAWKAHSGEKKETVPVVPHFTKEIAPNVIEISPYERDVLTILRNKSGEFLFSVTQTTVKHAVEKYRAANRQEEIPPKPKRPRKKKTTSTGAHDDRATRRA